MGWGGFITPKGSRCWQLTAAYKHNTRFVVSEISTISVAPKILPLAQVKPILFSAFATGAVTARS